MEMSTLLQALLLGKVSRSAAADLAAVLKGSFRVSLALAYYLIVDCHIVLVATATSSTSAAASWFPPSAGRDDRMDVVGPLPRPAPHLVAAPRAESTARASARLTSIARLGHSTLGYR